ncbi:MAG TPA: hypothetical protein VGO40_00950 [Longimicrobium sp.]|jgi:hypothetical protein|nr:hypothetical protein [Longimicrobium sp.]
MKIRTYAFALALAGAPVLLAAQQTPLQGRADPRGGWEDRRGGEHGGRQGGYQALLRYRQQLGLSDAQVSRLQSIQQQLRSRNAPIVERVDAARRQAGLPEFRARRGQAEQGMQGDRRRGGGEQRTDGQRRRGRGGRAQGGQRPHLTDQQRQAMRRFREQMKPLHEQMLRNRQEAMREAQAVLTPQQRQQVQQLMREHRGRDGDAGGERHGRRQRGESQG